MGITVVVIYTIYIFSLFSVSLFSRPGELSLCLVFDMQSILRFRCPNSEGGKLEMAIFPLADTLNSVPHVIAKRSRSAKENRAQWKRDRHGEGNPRQLGL